MFRHNDFDVRDVFRVLIRRRGIVLGAVACFLGLAVVLNVVTTPVFRTAARIAIQPAPSHSPLTGATVESPTANSENLALLTSAERILNRDVLERVARELRSHGLQVHPAAAIPGSSSDALRGDVDVLLHTVNVRPVRDTRLVDIQAEHSSPAAAAQIANCVATMFVRDDAERRHAADAERLAALRLRVDEVRRTIESSDRALYGSRNANLALAAERSRQLTGAAPELNASASKARADRQVVESQLARIQAFRLSAAPDWSNPPVQTEAMDELYRQLQKTETDLVAMRRVYREQSPEVMTLDTQSHAIRDAMRRELQKATSDLEGQRQLLLARERGFEQALSSNEHTLKALSDSTYKYSTLESQLATQRDLYTLLLKNVQEQEVAQTIAPASVEMVQTAPVPLGRVRPRKAVNLAVGFALGLLFGGGIALALESLRRTIRTPKDVMHELRLPVLGMIPRRQS